MTSDHVSNFELCVLTQGAMPLSWRLAVKQFLPVTQKYFGVCTKSALPVHNQQTEMEMNSTFASSVVTYKRGIRGNFL